MKVLCVRSFSPKGTGAGFLGPGLMRSLILESHTTNTLAGFRPKPYCMLSWAWLAMGASDGPQGVLVTCWRARHVEVLLGDPHDLRSLDCNPVLLSGPGLSGPGFRLLGFRVASLTNYYWLAPSRPLITAVPFLGHALKRLAMKS